MQRSKESNAPRHHVQIISFERLEGLARVLGVVGMTPEVALVLAKIVHKLQCLVRSDSGLLDSTTKHAAASAVTCDRAIPSEALRFMIKPSSAPTGSTSTRSND